MLKWAISILVAKLVFSVQIFIVLNSEKHVFLSFGKKFLSQLFEYIEEIENKFRNVVDAND